MTTADLKAVVTGEKKQSPVAAFSNFMDKLKPQMALALPKHLTADRMTRLAVRLTGAPVSFFSLVVEDHDFFKS